MKRYLKKFIPPIVFDLKNLFKKNPNKFKEHIIEIPRFKPFTTKIFESKINVPDSASFLFMYDEIFEKEIYKFQTSNPSPRIIDAGANIGLSVIYFKKLFPNASVIAFEPDEQIFNYLKKNSASFNLENVELINKALWNEITELSFFSEGADAGRINHSIDSVTIKTDLLSNYLNSKIDFLKIDIEGSELVVLEECKSLLKNVDRIFIEYHSFTNTDQDLSDLLKILETNGFRYNINSPGLSSVNPFIKINTYNGMDMQLNIFALKK